MNMRCEKGILIAAALGVLLVTLPVTAGIRNSNLHYELVSVPAVLSVAESESPGVRRIAFRLWWDGPVDTMTDISATFDFDPATLSHVGTHYDTLKWNGIFYGPWVDPVSGRISLEWDVGSILTPATPTAFAYIEFIPFCEAPSDSAKISFNRPLVTANEVTIASFDWTATDENFTDITLTELSIDCLSCCEVPGDANSDERTNIADITFLISRLFASGPAPLCAAEADANGDNSLGIADITYLIARIFGSGPSPICL